MPKLNVAVIFGGRSVEHDVSIITAHQAMAALSARHHVVPVYVTREGEWLTSPALNDLAVYRDGRASEVGRPASLSPVAGTRGITVPGGRLRGLQEIPVDVVVPAIHGTFGEDGTLQGLLELSDLPYTGSGVPASAVGMDKVAMKTMFKGAGLPVVDHYLVVLQRWEQDREAVLDGVESRLEYPLFVKPAQLGSSVGIGRAADRDELRDAIEVAAQYDTRILVEPSKEDCVEINCSVLGNDRDVEASVCEQPVARESYLSFHDKYIRSDKTGHTNMDGGTKGMAAQERLIPAPISEELTKQVQTNAVGAFNAVGASGVARVDSFLDLETNESWVMEINTVPGSFSFYLWEQSGINFPDLMDRLIDIAFARAGNKKRRMFTFDSDVLTRSGVGKTRD